MKIVIGEDRHKNWLIEEASVKMLVEELQRPELVNFKQIDMLVTKGIAEKTILVVEKDENPVGVIGALVINNLFNPDIKTLAELFWYVVPECRATKAPFLLLNAFTNLADSLQMEATFSLLLGPNSIKIETMEKRGFMLNEFAFFREAS